jgi:hypothetical protein
MKAKIQMIIAMVIVLIIIAVIFIQPIPDPRVEEYRRREEISRKKLQEIMHKFDSLEQNNKILMDAYTRLYSSLEVSEKERELIKLKYDKIKNRPYRIYTDNEVDSILSARYGQNND